MSFNRLHIENSVDCMKDRLRVFAEVDGQMSVVDTFCGNGDVNGLPSDLTIAEATKVRLVFKTNRKIRKKGFKLDWSITS